MTQPSTRYWAVIPAAGQGRRMGGNVPKQYLPINGFPLLCHTISLFLDHPQIAGTVVVVSEADQYWPIIQSKVIHSFTAKPFQLLIASGGKERIDSVYSGLKRLSSIASAQDRVLVHDAARPGIQVELIDQVILAAENNQGVILGLPITDTLKQVNAQGTIESTLDRNFIWQAQTPQCYPYASLCQGFEKALNSKNTKYFTDEASVMESLGIKTQMVLGSETNFKVTRKGDLVKVQNMLNHQLEQCQRVSPQTFFERMPELWEKN